MPSSSYIQRALLSAAIVFVLSGLVWLIDSWETALCAPWRLLAYLFENTGVVDALLDSPFAAGAATVAVLLLAAGRDLYAMLATVYFALNILATIQFLKS